MLHHKSIRPSTIFAISTCSVNVLTGPLVQIQPVTRGEAPSYKDTVFLAAFGAIHVKPNKFRIDFLV